MKDQTEFVRKDLWTAIYAVADPRIDDLQERLRTVDALIFILIAVSRDAEREQRGALVC